MAHITETRIGESTTTTGTGDVSLGGALTSHKTFSAVMSVGDTCFYDIAAVDSNGAETGDWEEGLGTYNTGNVLTRTTVLRSSNSDLAVSFSAGTKYVRLVAERRQVAAVPAGGSANQVLSKASGTDYDTQWTTGAQNAFSTVAVSGQSDVVADTSADILTLAAGSNITITTDAATDTVTITAASGGSPGGSGSEIQYRGGASTFSAVANSSVSSNGMPTWGSGTITASDPFTLTQTWNSSGVTFTGYKLNVTDTASASASLLADWQVAGSSKFKIDKAGSATAALDITAGRNVAANGGSFFASSGIYYANTGGNNGQMQLFASTSGTSGGSYLLLNGKDSSASGSYGSFLLSGFTGGLSADVAPGTCAIVGVAAQTGAVTNKNGGDIRIDGGAAAAGGVAGNIVIGNTRGFLITKPTTVASLPAASSALQGARSFVTDANATTFLSTVAAGGANKVPVVCDGTNWVIG